METGKNDDFPRKRKILARSLSPSIHWAQRHYWEPDQLMSRRIYDFELLYLEQGEAKAQIGRDGEPFVVAENHLLLIPAGVYHRVEVSSGKRTAFLGIHFDFFDELNIMWDQDIIVNEREVHDTRFCFLPDLESAGGLLQFYYPSPPAELVSLMASVILEFTEKPRSYEVACRGMLLQIISLLYKQQQVQQRNGQSPNNETVLCLAREIRERCSESWTNSRLSGAVNMHEDYMAKVFKAAVGMTPNRYVQHIRHQEAKRLLRETDDKIETIGGEIGYPDVHYFSRIFLKWEGIHASEYRKLSRLL